MNFEVSSARRGKQGKDVTEVMVGHGDLYRWIERSGGVCVMALCGKQAAFSFPLSWLKLSPPSPPPDWKYHKCSNVTLV